MSEYTSYRQPRSNWITMAVCALAFAVGVGLGVAGLVIEGASASIVVYTLGFAGMCAYSGWVAVEMAWTRVDVGYDWIRKRAPRGSRRVAFAEIVAFSEVRGLIRYGAHGSEFRLFTADGPPLTFSTQVAGWAAIVQTLHESIPWRVPPASALYARRGRNERLLDPYSALLSAPGQAIPEERASPRRIRWPDVLLAVLSGMVLVLPLAAVVSRVLQGSFGQRTWVDFGVMMLAILMMQATSILFVRWLRAWRMGRARPLSTRDDDGPETPPRTPPRRG